MLDRSDVGEVQFRYALGMFAASVTIITTFDDDGRPVGMTATAFASVSASSRLILACVNQSNRSLQWILDRRLFGVNILDSGLRAHSVYCARPGQVKTLDAAWIDRSTWNSPALADTLAYLDCRLERTMDADSHRVLLGEVHGIGLHKEERVRSPLVYYRGSYQTIGLMPGPRELDPLPIVF